METKPELLPVGAELVRWEEEPRPEKSAWGPGPWASEPDRVEWRQPYSALPRLVLRGPHGSWCGYVGLPPGHPQHGKSYDDDVVGNLEVHGGVTYGAECAGHICHVPREGESEHVWWIGFDCAHAGDVSPGLNYRTGGSFFGERYRDLAYIIEQTEGLARQLESAS